MLDTIKSVIGDIIDGEIACDSEVVEKLKVEKAELENIESRIEEYQEDSEFLDALRAAGVDNWEGYGFAYEIMKEDE